MQIQTGVISLQGLCKFRKIVTFNRGVMGFLGCFQGPAKINCGISVGASGDNGALKDRTAGLYGPVGNFIGAAFFNVADDNKGLKYANFR